METATRQHTIKETPLTPKTETAGAIAVNSTAPSTTSNRTPVYKRTMSWLGKLGAGIRLDLRARGPWYLSDWTDAWNYRVIPATALIFFAK